MNLSSFKERHSNELAFTKLVFWYESELYFLLKNSNPIILFIHKMWTATVIQVLVMGKKRLILNLKTFGICSNKNKKLVLN